MAGLLIKLGLKKAVREEKPRGDRVTKAEIQALFAAQLGLSRSASARR
ncbi:hypothetical protein [Sulfitobacter alexandrii]|nr:hypothetical protein [Sulfitobacter alexandrii]